MSPSNQPGNASRSKSSAPNRPVQVVIIGAGMSGLCMAITLLRAGITSFTILEKASDVGGTWRENTYPGLTCDIASPFYSYTFAPNPDWTHRFSAGDEIQLYLKSMVERYQLGAHLRLGAEVVESIFDGRRWLLRTADGAELLADVVVSATGVLHRPYVPDIAGLTDFAGAAFHSARWDHTTQIDGRRIGIIGTGSTGAQLVSALSTRAGAVTQFQRTAQWVLPLPNSTYSAGSKALLRRLPAANRLLYRFHQRLLDSLAEGLLKPGWKRTVVQTACRASLRMIRDRALRERLTPDYQPGCKRLVVSGDYLRAVQRPGVKVVTDKIDHIDAAGIVTADGQLHELDVIVLATGFDAHAYVRPMTVACAGGVNLDEVWRDAPRAHRTMMVPGFPNFFLLMGPNSPIGNTSLVPVAEAQAGFVLRWIQRLANGELNQVAATRAATDQFTAQMRNNMSSTVWASGCDSWYLDAQGTPILWPFSPKQFRDMLRKPIDTEYDMTRAGGSPLSRVE